MRPLLTPMLALMLALSLPAFAQYSPHTGHMTVGKEVPLTDGVVKKVDAKAGEVVVQHGPLDSIGMPPMTMAFGVADKVWLGKLKAGDKIRFAAEVKGGNAIISRYEMAK